MWVAVAAASPPAHATSQDVDEDCAAELPARAPHAAPRGRALGDLDAERCEQALREAAVAFERAGPAGAVAEPVRLRGPVGDGVLIRTHGPEPRVRGARRGADPRLDAVFDCRLVLALRTWASWVRAAGFEVIEHVSVFRPRARVASTGRPSGHARALAIDVLALVRPDGTRFTILDDWTSRARGEEPCTPHQEPAEQARVRELACRASREGLFQVVITPHHDVAHANHLHLEVRPDVDWAVVR